MSGRRNDSVRSRVVRRPLGPRLQLVVAPAVYYAAVPGLDGWQWVIVVVGGCVLAGLGIGVLRIRTVPWLLLTGLMGGSLIGDTLGLIGILDDFPRWVYLLGMLLTALVLQALLAVPVRPRPPVWVEIVRHRALILAGAGPLLLALLTGEDGFGESFAGQAIGIVVGLVLITWIYLVVRAVRSSRRTIRTAHGHDGPAALDTG